MSEKVSQIGCFNLVKVPGTLRGRFGPFLGKKTDSFSLLKSPSQILVSKTKNARFRPFFHFSGSYFDFLSSQSFLRVLLDHSQAVLVHLWTVFKQKTDSFLLF